MDLIEKLRLRAMAAVMVPDWDANFRAIARWYSREFSTELTKVYDLPVDFVLLHYMEHDYESMEEEKLYEAAQELITSPEVKEHEINLEKKSDDDFFEAARQKAMTMKSLKAAKNKEVGAAVDALGNQDILDTKKVEKSVPDDSLPELEFSIGEDHEFNDLMSGDPLSPKKK